MWGWGQGEVQRAVEELSDMHTLRTTGYLILSVEAFIVTWYWPQLFPPPSARKSSRRRARRGSSVSTGGSRRRLSEGWFGPGIDSGHCFSGPSSTYSGSRAHSSRGGSRGGGDYWRDSTDLKQLGSFIAGGDLLASRLAALSERQMSFASTASSGGASPPGSFRAIDLATSGSPTRTVRRWFVRPVLLVMLAASASYFLVYMLVVAESNVGIFPAERPSPAGAVNVVQMVDTPIATMSAEAAKQKVRTEQAQKSQTEQEQREKTERARKKQSNQAQVEAAAAAKAAAAAAAAAATAERRQILAAEKAERERRENAERERRKEIDERERKDKAEREERLQEQLVEAALAEAEKDEANKAREVRKRAEQLRTSKMATLGQDDAPLVVGQSLSHGATELRITYMGDLELSMDNETVWVATGSKKRGNPMLRLWRKLRNKPSQQPCTECRLEVTSSGRLELRDRRKLLWAGGQSPRRTKRQMNGDCPDRAGGSGGSGSGSCDYRLVVTPSGNAELKRLGVQEETVWQALPPPK